MYNWLMLLNDQERSRLARAVFAGEAFLRLEAWQSGLSHRAYPSADLWASKPLAGSREFESHRFHHLTSGTDAAETAPAPCLSPRDWAPRRSTEANISRFSRTRQRAPSPNVSDLARDEHPLPRQAN